MDNPGTQPPLLVGRKSYPKACDQRAQITDGPVVFLLFDKLHEALCPGLNLRIIHIFRDLFPVHLIQMENVDPYYVQQGR